MSNAHWQVPRWNRLRALHSDRNADSRALWRQTEHPTRGDDLPRRQPGVALRCTLVGTLTIRLQFIVRSGRQANPALLLYAIRMHVQNVCQ